MISHEFSVEDIEKCTNFLDNIKHHIDNQLFWRYHYLWLERDPFSKFIHIHNIFSRTNQPFDENKLQAELRWFRSELFMQGFLCCIEMASECFVLEGNTISQYIKNKFYNIGIPEEGKLKIKQGIDDLLTVLKTERPELTLPSLEIMPAFIDNLVKLVSHLTQKSLFVQKYLTANDFIHRSSIHSNSLHLEQVTESRSQSDDMKYINDLLLRILHNGIIKSDFNNYI